MKQDIVNKLKERVRSFQYTKENGEIRNATGTLNENVLPESKGASNSIPNDAIVHYFDMDLEAWRCFRVDRFVGFYES